MRLITVLGVLGFLSVAIAVSSIEGYNGYKIYEVIPKNRIQCDQLFELSKQEEFYDFFTLTKIPNKPARVIVAPQQIENFISFLKMEGITHQLLNNNLGETIELEFEQQKLLRRLKPISGKGRLSTERYYNHDEINNYIEDLAERYPSRVFIKRIGTSYEGRHMKTITVTNGDGNANKSIIFMDGGFHAREWISPATVLYTIDQLVENFAQNSDLLLNYDWVILPVVNPDGYEHTQTSSRARIWRKTRKPYKYLNLNCNGADPNRNFDFHWNEEGASSLPCSDTFAGPIAFSEPETIAVRDLMHSLSGRGIMYLTIHSYGNYLLYPWGWTSDLPDTWQDLDEVARAGGDAIYEATKTEYLVGSSTNVLYIASGASDDYGFYAGFPISITMELTAGGLTGFDPPPSSIDPYVKEAWIGIRAMARKVDDKYS